MGILETARIGESYYVWHDHASVASPLTIPVSVVDSDGLEDSFLAIIARYETDRVKSEQISEITGMLDSVVSETVLSNSMSNQNVLDVVKTEIGSTVEKTFYTERNNIKMAAVRFIKYHPSCTITDLKAAMVDLGYLINLDNFLELYITHNFNAERIADDTFEAFRDYIVVTSVEELMGVGD